MKKNYEKIKVEIIKYQIKDVLTDSPGSDENELPPMFFDNSNL